MLVVYGASDDLIEVEGDIREEFTSNDEGDVLAFSDGTVLRIEYGKGGVWRISPVVKGSAFERIDQAPEGGEDDYSDRAHFVGKAITWVVKGDQLALADRPQAARK